MAVGTSVFVMTFSAFTGSAFHILYQGYINPTPTTNIHNINFNAMILCVVFTTIFSVIASRFANKMNEKHLNIVSGIMLLCIAVTVLIVEIVK